MDNRYFFIKDRLKIEGMTIEYCPTAQMLADFFTKPLQGSLFRKFRDAVMGYTHIDSLRMTTEQSMEQERVGQENKVKDSSSSIDDASVKNTSVRNGQLTYADVAKKNIST
jgi:hypothetical protein